MRLVASGVITREIKNEQALDFGATRCDAAVVPLRSFLILFSNLCLLSIDTVALYSNLIFLEQRRLEFLIWAKKLGGCGASSLNFLNCFAPKLRKNRFSHTTFTLFFMFLLVYSMPRLCSRSYFVLFCILASLLIVAALKLLFVHALMSLLFLQFR